MDNFLHEVCDYFDNMVISGDFNLPDILLDSIDSALGVNELAFTESLHDHLLTQLNKNRTCGNNIFDLVITRVPNRVNVTALIVSKRYEDFLRTTAKCHYFPVQHFYLSPTKNPEICLR